MAADASAGAIIIAWVVTGIGIWFIANTFRILSAARPELTNGLYTYAEKGFGKLIGFFVAYGYWICNCFALVAYSVLVMATLNYFVPDFTGGNNIPSIIGGSIITWIMYLLALRGAKSTSFLNIIGTIGKLLPVIIFILAVATVFKFSVFMEGFWGMKDDVALTLDFSNVMPQVSSTMLVTLWLFLGIEGAVVVSGKAKSQAAVRKAIHHRPSSSRWRSTSSCRFCPSACTRKRKSGSMADPSMAAIMLKSFGKWGEIMVNAGVIVSGAELLARLDAHAGRDAAGRLQKRHLPQNVREGEQERLAVHIPSVDHYRRAGGAHHLVLHRQQRLDHDDQHHQRHGASVLLLLHAVPVQDRRQEGVPVRHLRQPRHGRVHGRGRFAVRTVADLRGRPELPHGGLHRVRHRLPLYIVGVRQHDRQAKLFEKRSDKVILAVVLALGIAGLIYSVITFGNIHI